ncbi:ankyrin repeat domain-containing protein [Methylomonas montana]|uniref:ankyrin repeat domain-containing protein n=1 Tax=Methylomonas montana TaxID=3058963 RepID=UPI002658CA15|nr:ankyrin repeat domain-containing protein [Methylomonas montana]WKJ88822.1 ankyrin repeat domain-containing protein [Methylomonas montana]
MPKLFICHASEDKKAIAGPLAEQLRQAGYQVWYDEYALKLGDSLRRSIDKGLAEADYGIVILSPAFFAKAWTSLELGGLTALDVQCKNAILPVWHRVNRADVERFSPMLADKLSISTDGGVAAVVAGIQRAVQGMPPAPKKRKRFPVISVRAILVSVFLMILGVGAVQLYSKMLAPQLAKAKLDALPLAYTPGVFIENAIQGNLGAVSLFLQAGMNPNIHASLVIINAPEDGTALMFAAYRGHIEVMQALLNAHADVNERNDNGDSALDWAAYGRHPEAIQVLLNAGIDNKLKDEAVGIAVRSGSMEILHLLLESGAKLDRAKAQDLLSGAVSYNHNPEIVKFLLSFGIDINAKISDGNSALHYAARDENSLPTLSVLLAHGANINARNDNGETPIMDADSPTVLRVLIAGGADVNAKDNRGNSVLTAFFGRNIAKNDLEQIIKTLIERGADVNALVKEPPISPLIELLSRQDYDDLWLLNLLIDNGADVNFKDDQGFTPLMSVLMYFSDLWGEEDYEWLIAKVSKLLEKGAKVQDRAADGKTALKLAEKLPKGTKTRVLKLLQNRI